MNGNPAISRLSHSFLTSEGHLLQQIHERSEGTEGTEGTEAILGSDYLETSIHLFNFTDKY